MFLFRKKKENPEVKEEAKPEVKKAAPPVKVVDKNARAAAEKAKAAAEKAKTAAAKPAPVAVKPAATPKVKTVSAQPQSPEDIADSLLVKVDHDPEIENSVDDAMVEAVLKPVAQPASSSPVVETAPPVVENSDPVDEQPGEDSSLDSTGDNSDDPEETTSISADTDPPETATGPVSPVVAPAGTVPVSTDSSMSAPVMAAAPVGTGSSGTAEAAKPEEKKPDSESKEDEDKGNLFSSLFGNTEVEEETPVDRLIKSLPDISIEEVMSEADEVKNLINEWYQAPGRD